MIAKREKPHGTTIICVRKKGQVVMASDGQATAGWSVALRNAEKVRKIGKGKKQTLVAMAGAFKENYYIMDLVRGKLDKGFTLHEALKDLSDTWVLNSNMREFNSWLIFANRDAIYLVNSPGDVLEVEDDFVTDGSGHAYATGAASILIKDKALTAKQVATKALKVAAENCVMTNGNIKVLTL